MQLHKLSHRLSPVAWPVHFMGLAIGIVITLAFCLVITYQPVAAHSMAPSPQESTPARTLALTSSAAFTTTTIIYVDRSAGGNVHNGLSWATAFTTLQDGLAAATSGTEIWVADGIYYPDEGGSATNNSRSATFRLQQNVALYGGFAGSETARTQRNWQTNLTVLSGDLSQNDPDKNSSGIITNPATTVTPNAYQVVTISNVSNSILDGFVITGGKADGSYVSPCSVACGGGLFVDSSSPTITNLTIAGNGAAYYGAGMANISSSPLVTNVTIQANRAEISGGGLYNRGGSPSFTNVLISGNRSLSQGGGIYNDRTVAPAKLTNVTITGNRATISGGAIYNATAVMSIVNSIIANNFAGSQSELNNRTSTISIQHSLIENAFAGGSWDSALGSDNGDNLGSDPLFTAPLDPVNAPLFGGDYTLLSLSPAADGGDLTQNSTTIDVAGAARLQGATIDMGAFESPHTAQLSMTVVASPTQIEYGEPVTYTVVLTNSGNAYAYYVQVTDTLPSNVAFTHWLQQPTGATYQSSNNEITWGGAVAASQAITYQFVITHTGGPAETITNTVEFAHVTSNGTATGVFAVVPLPTATVADVNVNEAGQWARFTVTLNKTTRKSVTINYVTANGSAITPADYNARNTNLLIPPGQLSGVMLIPVASDFVDETDENFGINLNSPVNATIADGAATATIIDDDTAGATVGPTTLGVSEPQSSAVFTITLRSQPIAPVNVASTNSDSTECSLPNTVQLDATNWRGVAVTVTAVDDFIVDGNRPCQITLTATSTDPLYNGIALSSVGVTVQSDDVAGIGMAPSALILSEPVQSKQFTITLTSQPTASVTVDLISGDLGECTVPASVSLDENNWAQGVAVQVSALNDDVDDDDQLCTVQTQVHSVDANYNGRTMSNLPVTVQDDDSAGVTVSTVSLTTAEPNGTQSFGISLNSEPTAPVTVALTVSDSSECTVPASIVLDASNWNAVVSVLVTALDDRIDDGNQLCVVQTAVSSSDAKYNAIVAADVAVTVQDDSDQAGVTITPATQSVSEPNTTASFTVALDSQPIFPVTIALTSLDSGECSVPASVVLNSTNWQQGRQVTVTGVNDDFIDGAQSCVITTSATSSDTNYNAIAVADPTVTVQDDDYAEVLLNAVTPTVIEPSSSTVMVLKLTSRPTAPVTVTLQSADPDECSVPAQVVLNSTNWKTGVGTNVSAVDDDIDDDNRTCRITSAVRSSDSDYNALAVNLFSLTVQDNDTAGTVVSPAVLNVSEPDSSATFTVTLTSEPTATVTVNLFSSDLSECRAPATVTIAPAQWRTGVAIPVTAVDDAIKDNARPCLLQTTTSSSDAKYNALAIADVNLTVADDDQAGVVVSPTSLTTQEPDGVTTFTITLTSEPTATVTVNLVSTEVSECSAPASVTLDANNWGQGVGVAVAALNDAIDDGAQACGIQTIVSSVDKNYAGIAAADVGVTVNDDSDTAGIIVSSTALTVSEPSAGAFFTVALTSEPLTAVTINLTSSDPSECSAPAAVVLTPANWADGVGVPVTGVNDDVDDQTQPCTVQTRATSTDLGYNNRAVADIAVIVLDEDSAGIALDRIALTITEPSEVAFFTVTLNSEPTAAVTVNLASSDPSECSVPASVVLDALNWRTGVAVATSAVNDDLMDGSQACTVQTSVASADPNYNNRTLADLAATVVDEDVAGIVVSPTTLTLNEFAGTGSFTVALTSEPVTNVTVNLLSRDTSACTVLPAITLTPQNWRQGLSVTVNAVDDNRADGDQPCPIETTATSADPAYADYPTADVAATVRDDDRIAVLILSTTLAMQEPTGEVALTVRLGSEPVAPVVVNFSVNDQSECRAPASVTLDSNNWRSGTPIRVKAADDQIDDGVQSCQLGAQSTSTDPDYNGYLIQPVTMTVADNDVPALAFAAWPDRPKAEVGEVITYTYRMTNTGDVTLTTQLADGRLGALMLNQTQLAPGAVMTQIARYTVQEADLPGPLQSSATVTAQSTMGALLSDTQHLTVALSALPQLEIDVLRLGPPDVVRGTVVTFQVSITNVGHITAKITDLQGGPVLATAAAVQATSVCSDAPFTIAPNTTHRCILLWDAVKGDTDAVKFAVTVAAEGLLNFTSTVSDSDIVIVSGPTSAGYVIYLPLVRK